MKNNKINFKQPKYVLPIIILPFVFLIVYMIGEFKTDKKPSLVLEERQEINSSIQEASIEKKETDSKFKALQKAFKSRTDFSGIQTIEKEDGVAGIDENSLYTMEEMRQIDSLNQASSLREKEMLKMQEKYRTQNFLVAEESLNSQQDIYSSTNKVEKEKSRVDEEMELFKKQMAFLDSVQNPEKYQKQNTPAEPIKLKENEQIKEVFKSENVSASYFNTIKSDKPQTQISAILDESVSVKNDYRVKIRLLDDITIENNIIKKGAYLYGTVYGFQQQRVLINISSILVDQKIVKVNLVVYDNDGQEGFYIPNNAFREFARAVGGKAQSQNISFDRSPEAAKEFALGAVQDIYKSMTQAVSKHIRQNKAKLKYGTHVYLINNTNQ